MPIPEGWKEKYAPHKDRRRKRRKEIKSPNGVIYSGEWIPNNKDLGEQKKDLGEQTFYKDGFGVQTWPNG